MNILLFEWLTGGGFRRDHPGNDPPSSMLREGAAMVGALAEDLTRAGHQIQVLADLPRHAFPPVPFELVPTDPRALPRQLLQLARKSCAVLPIAPETDDCLGRTLAWLEPVQDRLLCPTGPAVRVGSSKQSTADVLAAAGVQPSTGYSAAIPAGWSPGDRLSTGSRAATRLPDSPTEKRRTGGSGQQGPLAHPGPDGWIIKPDDGAGSEDVHWFSASSELSQWLRQWSDQPDSTLPDRGTLPGNCDTEVDLDAESPPASVRRWRIEPFLPGQSVSVAVIGFRQGGHVLLPPTRQRFASETAAINGPGAVRFPPGLTPAGLLCWPGPWVGFDYPLSADLAERATRLARRALSALPRFHGPAGLDLVLAESPERDRVVDFNPRLTSSWVGLRNLFHENLASLLLEDSPSAVTLSPTRDSLRWRPFE